jgi:hypothetical protein
MESVVLLAIINALLYWPAYIVMVGTLMAVGDLAIAAFTVAWMSVRVMAWAGIRPRTYQERWQVE